MASWPSHGRTLPPSMGPGNLAADCDASLPCCLGRRSAGLAKATGLRSQLDQTARTGQTGPQKVRPAAQADQANAPEGLYTPPLHQDIRQQIPMKILVNLFHSDLQKSTVNRRWLRQLESHSEITINQPYIQYPEGIINISREIFHKST